MKITINSPYNLYKTPYNSYPSTNKQPVSFFGLTKDMKKISYANSNEIKEEIQKFPKSNGIVGNLPPEWINKIPPEKRKKVIKEFYKSLKTTVNEFRTSPNKDTAVSKLIYTFKKAGIMNEKEKLDLVFLGSGAYGQVYKIKFQDISGNTNKKTNNEYVIKIFDSNDEICDRHGNYIELNRAAFWQHNAGKNTERVRFYFGDLNAGYMINKYIDNAIPICKKNTPVKIYGLRKEDETEANTGHNKINGYAIDYGGFVVTNETLAKNKTARFIYKKINSMPSSNKIDEFNKWMNVKNNDDVKIGLLTSLPLIDEPLREDFYKSIFNTNNENLQKVLAEEIKVLPENKRFDYFVSLTNNKNNEIKKILSNGLIHIPANERFNAFKILLNDANQELKESLASHIDYLNESVESFKLISKDADLNIKKILASNIGCLPVYQRDDCFNTLMEDANKDLKIVLIQNIKQLPNASKIEWFENFNKEANNDFKIALAKELKFMPQNERNYCFKLLANNANTQLKETLATKINILPEDKRFDAFKLIAKDADIKLKKILARNLNMSNEDIAKCFELIAPDADNELKSILINYFKVLPKYEFKKWFNRFIKNSNSSVKTQLIYHLDEFDDEQELIKNFKLLSITKDKKVKELLMNSLYLLPQSSLESFENELKNN